MHAETVYKSELNAIIEEAGFLFLSIDPQKIEQPDKKTGEEKSNKKTGFTKMRIRL